MDSMLQITRQEAIEQRYSRKHIDSKIRKEIADNPDMVEKANHAVVLLEAWLAKTYYASKETRLAQIRSMDLLELVYSVFQGVSYCQTPELFTSVTVQMAGRLRFTDKKEAITTVAEILAVICPTDAFDIVKASPMGSLMVQSRIPLSEELIGFILNSQYLPPMVCKPLELASNYSSGYLSHNDSLILGNGNHHDGDICLDVLNIVNGVSLRLDTEFLSTVEENPNTEITVDSVTEAAAKKGIVLNPVEAAQEVTRQRDQWMKFKAQSYEFYLLMAQMGNEFYLTHKVDKRGRIYSQGYHLNPQGTAFKKAMIELSNQEIVEGVPDEYRI